MHALQAPLNKPLLKLLHSQQPTPHFVCHAAPAGVECCCASGKRHLYMVRSHFPLCWRPSCLIQQRLHGCCSPVRLLLFLLTILPPSRPNKTQVPGHSDLLSAGGVFRLILLQVGRNALPGMRHIAPRKHILTCFKFCRSKELWLQPIHGRQAYSMQHTCMHAHTHTRAHTCPRSRAQTHTHDLTHMHTLTLTRTRAHTRTHTHTHSHTRMHVGGGCADCAQEAARMGKRGAAAQVDHRLADCS